MLLRLCSHSQCSRAAAAAAAAGGGSPGASSGIAIYRRAVKLGGV